MLLKLHEEDPNDHFVLFGLAKEHEKISDWDQAVAYYNTLKSIAPNYVGLYYHLAAALIEIDASEDIIQKTYEEGILIATSLEDHHAKAELQNAFQNWTIENL